MKRNRIILTAGAAIAALALAACGGSSGSDSAADAPASEAAAAEEAPAEEAPADDAAVEEAPADDMAAAGDVPSWCGPNEITLGFADGFGGNVWRLVTTETGRREAALCPSVKELIYTDGQGDLQKSISDIQGLVSQGADALVVFPDASEAILPTLKEAYDAGVVTVPYRVYPAARMALTTPPTSPWTPQTTARTTASGSRRRVRTARPFSWPRARRATARAL